MPDATSRVEDIPNGMDTHYVSPGAGWQFGHWEGDVSPASSTSKIIYVMMNADKTLTAVMKACLHIEKEGPGTITPAEGNLFLDTGQQVQLTATPDPGCKFKQWLITPYGADVSESYVLDEPNPVLDFQRPMTARATFAHTYGLQVSARGNGSVGIEPEKEIYEDGETVVLSAQGDPGWAFDHWTGDVMGMRTYDASAQVWMIENRSITAVFIERPGLTEVDFIGDLEYFLQDIGAEEDISTFDGNEIRYNAKVERVYAGNGIPDVAELCLVEAILNRRSLDHSFRSGVYHDFIWDIWNVNLAQAAVDLPDEDPRIHRVVAGYMTLGDYKSEGFIDKLVTIHYNSEGLNTAAYETNGQRYLYYKADADNDGVSNYQEWEYASPDNSIANIPEFVDAALDGVKPQGSQQSAFADSPMDLFAPEMDQRFAAAGEIDWGHAVFHGSHPHVRYFRCWGE